MEFLTSPVMFIHLLNIVFDLIRNWLNKRRSRKQHSVDSQEIELQVKATFRYRSEHWE